MGSVHPLSTGAWKWDSGAGEPAGGAGSWNSQSHHWGREDREASVPLQLLKSPFSGKTQKMSSRDL